jgi:flagellar basal-body rod modification protein FlgD
MAIEAIGIPAGSDVNVPRAAAIDQEHFLEILLTQLRFQDPMKPVDNQAFVAQLAQFSALEITRQQSEKVDALLTINAAGQAIGLIGQRVDVLNAFGESVGEGEVTAVRFVESRALLSLRTSDGRVIPDVGLANISIVRKGT